MSAYLSEFTIKVRQDVCRRCPHPCEDFKLKRIDFADPSAFCSVHWAGSWGAVREGSAPPSTDASPVKAIEKIVEAGAVPLAVFENFFNLTVPLTTPELAPLRKEYEDAVKEAGGERCAQCVLGRIRLRYKIRVESFLKSSSTT